MKVKLFTHTDLDGLGCAIVGRWAFGTIDVTYCDYDKVDEKVTRFIESKEHESYDKIFITDISVKPEVADLIQAACAKKTILLDHHATAGWLNEYEWATVSPIKIIEVPGEPNPHVNLPVEEEKTAGTSMFYDYVVDNGYLESAPYHSQFVENVRRWDTWDWFNLYKVEYPKRLNNLLYLIGREKFAERFVNDPTPDFKDGEVLVLEIEEEKIKKYIEKVANNLIRANFLTYENVGIVFAENYTSELGNTICNNYPELDFVMIINVGGGSISFRGIHDNIDLGQVAKLFGGGGHPKAAGAKLQATHKNSLINYILFQGEAEHKGVKVNE